MKKIIYTILFAQLNFMILNIYGQNCAGATNIYKFTCNGKNYEIIKEKKTWEDAAKYAVERGGYLVHINNQTEQDSVYNAIINDAGVAIDYADSPDGGMIAYVWIGANDITEEGTWIWDGDNEESGTNFWTGTGSPGNAVNDAFVNWGRIPEGTPHEPDNYSNQDAAGIGLADWPEGRGHLGNAGEWNDIDVSNEFYFVIEYNKNNQAD